MESKQLHSIIGIWTNACRFLLAAVFIFSGFVKAVDPLGTQYKIQDYLEVFGWAASVPAFLPFLASVLQAMVEFCLGVYLLFGIRRRMTTLFVVLIMGVMTPLTLWLALSNPISDCGCFGDAVTLTNWETFGKNVLLLIAAVSVFKWGNRITPLVTKRFDWLVAMYTFLYISGMTLYCYRELPVFDFRPYHIGADIRKGMEIPEGEKPTVYETRFILQKDGVEKEFTLENYPDSTWTFVDSKTMVKEQGYEPPIHDFSIIRQEDGEDITDEVLDDDNYTFLLVAHQLSQADDSTIDLINELYDYSVEHGYQFYCLTSSPDSDIEDWQERTGAEYPFCLMDDITLKTMIRSNPGLMLLKNGVVINKWSVNSLPDEYVLTDRLEKLPLAQINEKTFSHKVVLVLAWFVFPLLFFSMVDVIWEHLPAGMCCIELNTDMKRYLSEKPYGVSYRDFLDVTKKEIGTINRVVMNPPFTRHQDIDHVRHAYDLLDAGGVLVAIMCESTFSRSDKKSVEFRDFLGSVYAQTIKLEPGAFRESGTDVVTRIVKIRKPM